MPIPSLDSQIELAARIERGLMIEQHLHGMRVRDCLARALDIRLDIRVMQCESAVDRVFARQHYEPERAK